MKNNKIILFCLFALIPLSNFSMMNFGGNTSSDAFSRINYIVAFDQEKIYEKFEDSLKKWGCYKNVCEAEGEPEVPEVGEIVPSELEEFQRACLVQLRSARMQCLTEDARNQITNLLIVGGICLAIQKLPVDSRGQSWSVYSAVASVAYSMPSFIQTLYNFIISPTNILAQLEERFAKEKCFIPKELHPAIIQKFMTARSNLFEQQAAINFLEFALGLSLYKPKTMLSQDKDNILKALRKSLFPKIDAFFADYDDVSAQDMWILKNNVYTFVSALLDNKNSMPRYLYLYGPGGIGKTYFINKLYQWLDELLPHTIKFENCIITNSEELEGSPRRPGMILRVLRNQLMEGKRGSLVFMDEATWLSRFDMNSSAKRIFNGNQTHLATDYFGNDIEGSGIQLKAPAMLICLACNIAIEDPALKTRFDTVSFPIPKQKVLVDYARKFASENRLLNQKKVQKFDFDAWLEKTKLKNFRDIESQIVSAILVA